MAKDWVMVRLEAGLHEDLQIVRDIFREMGFQNKREVDLDNRDRLSLSNAVRILLELYWRRRGRADESRRKQAKKKLEDLLDSRVILSPALRELSEALDD